MKGRTLFGAILSAQFDPQADLWLDVDEFESLASHEDVSNLQAAVAP